MPEFCFIPSRTFHIVLPCTVQAECKRNWLNHPVIYIPRSGPKCFDRSLPQHLEARRHQLRYIISAIPVSMRYLWQKLTWGELGELLNQTPWMPCRFTDGNSHFIAISRRTRDVCHSPWHPFAYTTMKEKFAFECLTDIEVR